MLDSVFRRWSLEWQALGDLIARHALVWRTAWAQRSLLDRPAPSPEEAQFLPAALALQDTPVSPAPRVAMGLLVMFLLLTLAWSIWGQIDIVAVGQGKVVPNGRTKVVQPLEAATIKSIHVKEGQAVRAGDLLVELDSTVVTADSERVAIEVTAAQLQLARGQELLTALESGRPPRLPASRHLDAVRQQEAQRFLDGQYAEYLSRIARADADIKRREAELSTTRALVEKLERTLPIVSQRATDYRALVDQAFASQHGFLEHEQARIEMEVDLMAQRHRLREIAAAKQEAEAMRATVKAETRRAALDSMEQAQQRLDALAQERLKAEQRGRLTRLLAPVDGTVQQLALHTEGGVVTPAQALLLVVPSGQPVEVEGVFENRDVGFLRPGMPVEVKVETFPFTKYGTVPAKLVNVSHDAVSDERRGLIYTARIQLERDTIEVDGTDVKLMPGMVVSAEVKTGRRRVIEYLLSPLMQHTRESLRER